MCSTAKRAVLDGPDILYYQREALLHRDAVPLEQRAGEGGFGYDPLFRYHTGKTFAEMTEKEKNAVSHRAVAAEKMRGVLAEAL